MQHGKYMLSIGDLSKATQLTIKTIRLYHEKGLLPPTAVDELTGYRYYDSASVERARVIKELRNLEFSLVEIAEILTMGQNESDIIPFLEAQKSKITSKMVKYQEIQQALELVINNEREALMSTRSTSFKVEEKIIEDILIAGIRAKGAYGDSGKRFAKLGRAVGRYMCGKPLNLCFDAEYKEYDADFESCFPIKKTVDTKEGITVRKLQGGRCVSLLHLGPYDSIGKSYQRVLEYVSEMGLKGITPSREIYVKGPGMIFKGNPKKYLTEIQVLIETETT